MSPHGQTGGSGVLIREDESEADALGPEAGVVEARRRGTSRAAAAPNGPGATRKLLAAVTKCQKQVHRTGKPKTVRNDGVTVHGWPVHTPEWKREILRTVAEEG